MKEKNIYKTDMKAKNSRLQVLQNKIEQLKNNIVILQTVNKKGIEHINKKIENLTSDYNKEYLTVYKLKA